MSTELDEEHKKLIRDISSKEGFRDYTIEVKCGAEKGDNYVGVIKVINIVDKNSKKSLNLLLKSAPTSESLRKKESVRSQYGREIYMYEKVFKVFDDLQQSLEVKNKFQGKPVYYGGSLLENKECLILENLKYSDFKLWDRAKPMNADHIGVVFKEYGRFHGLAMGLKAKNVELYNKIVEPIRKTVYNSIRSSSERNQYYRSVLEKGLKTINGNIKATKALEKFINSVDQFFNEDLMERQHEVILHRDCWCNNVMFQYKDENHPEKPTQVSLIDFQTCVTGIPAQDLSYFLYSSCTKEVLKDHKTFLKLYHESLSEILNALGCNPNEIFPYEILESQWKKISKYGLYRSMLIFKVMLCKVEETPNLEELTKSGKNVIEAITFDPDTDKNCNKRISELIEFLVENDYL